MLLLHVKPEMSFGQAAAGNGGAIRHAQVTKLRSSRNWVLKGGMTGLALRYLARLLLAVIPGVTWACLNEIDILQSSKLYPSRRKLWTTPLLCLREDTAEEPLCNLTNLTYRLLIMKGTT